MKLFRPTAHIVSMIAPQLIVVALISLPFQLNLKHQEQSANQEQRSQAHILKTIESTPVNDVATAAAAQDTADKTDEWPDTKILLWLRSLRHRLWAWGHTSGPAEWTLVIVGIAAGIVTYLSLRHTRQAVRLTERADVLFETVKFLDPRTSQFTNELRPDTHVVMVTKNFGRTTAIDVRVRWRFFIEGEPVPETEFLSPIVLGAGKEQETRFPDLLAHAPFLDLWHGRKILRVLGEVTFRDTFGDPHRSSFQGRFRSFGVDAGGFEVEVEDRH